MGMDAAGHIMIVVVILVVALVIADLSFAVYDPTNLLKAQDKSANTNTTTNTTTTY